LRPVGHQTRNKFARIGPNSAERVSRNQYAHRTPGVRGLGATLGLLATSLVSTSTTRKEFSCVPQRRTAFQGHAFRPALTLREHWPVIASTYDCHPSHKRFLSRS
jgi:hypothetical protein